MNIKNAIVEMYPEELEPAAIAETLTAAATAAEIEDRVVVLWIYDRPRHPLDTAELLRWAKRMR